MCGRPFTCQAVGAAANRIVDLQKQLAQLREKLAANPAGMSFKSVLTELGIVNARFGQLHKEIRPHLQFYVAHPQHLGQHDVVSTPLALHTRQVKFE